jgi:hypothetical protein
MLLRRIAFVSAFSVFAVVLPARAASDCNLSASASWKADAGRTLRTESFSNGAACKHAVVTLVVREASGKALWVDAAPAEQLMTFVEARSRKQMKRALRDWLFQSHNFKSTAELPEWKKGAEGPMNGEFPFYAEPDVDRETYERIRAEKQPVFCYVQGMESMACLGLSKDGALTKIGVQLFPG